MTRDQPAIEIDSLVFRWPGSNAPCLDLVTLQVPRGGSVFLQGQSGSGKSTLLGLLTGVHTPTSGTVRVLGEDLGRMGAAARDRFRGDHIGYIFQQFNLVPYLSVIDNVLLPCRFSASRRERAGGGAALRDEARRLLARLDLAGEILDRDVSQLSVGQQQRVAAARSLIGAPGLVVADEPTSALDASRQEAFLELLQAECAAASAALVFASHDLRLSSRFDRVIALPAQEAA